MSLMNFEDPFRPAYESYAAGAWGASAIAMGLCEVLSPLPSGIFAGIAVLSVGMFIRRTLQAARIEKRQQHMDGVPLTFMPRKALANIIERHPDKIFLGYGFPWSREEAQVVHTLKRHDPERLYPRDTDIKGQRWIHGLGVDREREVLLPFDHAGGMTFILGTTGSGKTRMLDTVITQMIARGLPVIILDPKSDAGLQHAIEAACKAFGRADAYCYFHPAHPERSVRLDLLKNFVRASEVATRLATLVQRGATSDPFVNFGQMAMMQLASALLMLDEKPSIDSMRSLLETGFDGLTRRCIETHIGRVMGDTWRNELQVFRNELAPAKGPAGGGGGDRELKILIQFYKDRVKGQGYPTDNVVEGLISASQHDREHAQKMLVSLMPVLAQLTAGPLKGLLSPDYDDPKDTRRITNLERVIQQNQVLYVALDSLSDPIVASCIGALLLTDAASMAAARYNFAKPGEKLSPWVLIGDEASEYACVALNQLLNKSRGSGGNVYLCTQSVVDMAVKMGSTDAGMQSLGSLNNVVSLRVTDTQSQEYVAAKMLDTVVRSVSAGQSTRIDSDNPLLYASTISESMKEETVPLVAPTMLNCLPDLEFFANISAGRVEKCRIPILVDDKEVAVV